VTEASGLLFVRYLPVVGKITRSRPVSLTLVFTEELSRHHSFNVSFYHLISLTMLIAQPWIIKKSQYYFCLVILSIVVAGAPPGISGQRAACQVSPDAGGYRQ
jgi:hypothetical protein